MQSLKPLKKRQGAICFYADHPGQITQQLPVLRALEAKGYSCVFLVHKPQFYNRLNKEGIHTAFIPINFMKAEQPLTKDWIKIEKIDGSVWGSDSIIKQIEDLALVNFALPYLMSFAQKWIKQTRPIAFVPGYDLNPACRIMTLAFKSAGVPCFCIQHGAIGKDPILAKSHIVDHFLAFGSVTYENLLAADVKYQIHVTGPPYLKGDIELAKKNHVKMVNILPGRRFDKIVLIAFSGAGHGTSKNHLNEQIRSVTELAKQQPDLGFIFKLHPKDQKSNYQVAANIENCFVVSNGDFKSIEPTIFDWFERCSAVITGASAVAMEALIMGKPVFTLDFMGEYSGMDFIRAGATLHSTKPEEFQQLFQDWLVKPAAFSTSHEKGQRFIESFFAHKEDAAERCAEVIIQQCNTEQNS